MNIRIWEQIRSGESSRQSDSELRQLTRSHPGELCSRCDEGMSPISSRKDSALICLFELPDVTS